MDYSVFSPTRVRRAEYVEYNADPIGYDPGDYSCVYNCDALYALAASQPPGRSWLGVCWFGGCGDDNAQVRDMIREAVAKQGIFDGSTVRREFTLEQARGTCLRVHDQQEDCFTRAFDDRAEAASSIKEFRFLFVASLGTLPDSRTTPPQALVDAIALSIIRSGAGSRVMLERANLARALRQCFEIVPLVDQWGFGMPRSRCETMPIFWPGQNVREATLHKWDALMVDDNYQEKHWILNYLRGGPSGLRRNWYSNYSPCNDPYDGQTLHCDEYPYKSSSQSGPKGHSEADDAAGERRRPFSLRIINSTDNIREGTFYRHFSDCPRVEVGGGFLVVPMAISSTQTLPIDTGWVC